MSWHKFVFGTPGNLEELIETAKEKSISEVRVCTKVYSELLDFGYGLAQFEELKKEEYSTAYRIIADKYAIKIKTGKIIGNVMCHKISYENKISLRKQNFEKALADAKKLKDSGFSVVFNNHTIEEAEAYITKTFTNEEERYRIEKQKEVEEMQRAKEELEELRKKYEA